MRRAPLLPIALLACAALAGASCGPGYPTVDCQQVVWVLPKHDGARVEVVGSWDGWKAPGVAASPADTPGWQIALLSLPPGEYGYQVVIDGAPRLDPFQPLTTFRGDEEVSL